MDTQRFTTEHKTVTALTREEYRQCYMSSYHKDKGEMKDQLQYARYHPNQSEVVMCKDHTGRVRAWSMINRRWHPQGEVYYWTQRRYRRRGLGRMVAQHVHRLIGTKYDHFPVENPPFFEAIGAKL